MSSAPQPPENSAEGNLPDFSRNPIGYGETELWELDDDPAQFPMDLEETTKSYGVMEKNVSLDDSQSSQAQPAAESPKLFANLTGIEKSSLIAIVAALAICAALGIKHFSKEIPVDSKISRNVILPVEGKILNVSNVETYWRKPITQGETIDVVRRGAILVPSIKIQVSGKSGAIRIFFRDSDGTLVGDSTTLAITGNQDLTISATDGFSDMSMHAYYRTGEQPRWMIQAFEGPAVDAPIEQFQPLFETEISTDIR